MFPQLVKKVNVVGKDFAMVFGCATDGAACGRAVALVQFFTGSLLAAETAGAKEAAVASDSATIKVRFIMSKEYRPAALFPLNSCWGFASNIQSNSIDFAHLVGNARRDFSQNIVWDSRPISGHRIFT